jgi:glutamate racemase
MVEAGLLAGSEVEAGVRDALAPLLGERDAAGEFVFPLPASARIDTLLLGCTHYPLLRPVIARIAGERVAIVDSATATASALVELLAINGLEAPGTTRGTAADAGAAGHDRNDETAAEATHVQLTTGDVDAFRVVAERIFGEAFPDVVSVEVGPAGTATPARVAS